MSVLGRPVRARVDDAGIDHLVSLRALDWRYLLPRPADGPFRRLALLGGGAALAGRLVDLGVAQRVSLDLAAAEPVDAVVILHPAALNWQAVGRCLTPDGVFYVEVETRPAPAGLTYHRLRRRLREAGLAPQAVYWVRPGLADRQMYVPLDAPGALHWYLDTLHTPTSAAQRLLATGLRRLAHWGETRFALPLTGYAVTGSRQEGRGQAGMIVRPPLLPLAAAGHPLYPLVITAGHDGNRVALLPFSGDGQHPLAVFKVARHPALNHRVEDEQAALRSLQAALDPSLARTIPRPLGSFEWAGLSVGVESAARGRPLSTSAGPWGMSRRQQIQDLRQVVDWLTRFNRAAQTGSGVWGEAEVAEWVEAPLAAYADAFGPTPGEEALFQTARRRARDLVGRHLPLVWVHWGFDERNLFRQGEQLTVIDWEGGSPGPPLYDLLHFVIRWSWRVRDLHVTADQWRDTAALFCASEPDDGVHQAVRQVIEGYLAALDLDRRFVPLFLVTMLVQRALGQVHYQTALQGAGATRRAGNRYVDALERLAEQVDGLWGECDKRGS